MEPVTSVCGKAMVLSILFVQLGVCQKAWWWISPSFHFSQRLKKLVHSTNITIERHSPCLPAPARYNRLRKNGTSVALCVRLRHRRLPGEIRRNLYIIYSGMNSLQCSLFGGTSIKKGNWRLRQDSFFIPIPDQIWPVRFVSQRIFSQSHTSELKRHSIAYAYFNCLTEPSFPHRLLNAITSRFHWLQNEIT